MDKLDYVDFLEHEPRSQSDSSKDFLPRGALGRLSYSSTGRRSSYTFTTTINATGRLNLTEEVSYHLPISKICQTDARNMYLEYVLARFRRIG